MGEGYTSRLIIRNVPRYYTEEKLRKYIQEQCATEVTDLRIPKDAAGKSRQFAFVGVRDVDSAKGLIQRLDRTFLDTSRISVASAYAPGSKELPRPWSRHTPGSTAYDDRIRKKEERKVERLQQKQKSVSSAPEPATTNDSQTTTKTATEDDLLRSEFFALEGKRKGQATWSDSVAAVPPSKRRRPNTSVVRVEAVAPTKAGVAKVRQHIQFEDDEDDAECPGEAAATSSPNVSSAVSPRSNPIPAEEDVQDEQEDSLAWLRAKSSNVQPEEPDVGQEATQQPSRGDEAEAQSESEDDVEKEPKLKTGDKSNEENQNDEETEMALLAETGRLLILNHPYSTSEKELKEHLSTFGEVADVHICRDEVSLHVISIIVCCVM